jgi:hypothetical protein
MRQHKKEFAQMLIATAELYGKSLSSMAINVYYELLIDFDYAVVNKAFNALARQSKFMPKPAEILEAIENKQAPDALAETAYNKLVQARKEIGAYKSVIFDDPIIHRIVEQHGGWPVVCRMSKEDEQYTAFKKNFIQEYKSFMGDKNYSYPLKLAGISEITNNAEGFEEYIPSPVVIGNKTLALTWIQKAKKIEAIQQQQRNKEDEVLKEIESLLGSSEIQTAHMLSLSEDAGK